MELKGYQHKILDLYLEQELLLARLYALLSEKFADHRDFWTGLVGEEREHAAWVRKLHEEATAGRLTFSEGKTRSYTLEAYIRYMNGVIDHAREQAFHMKKALSIALDVENSLIENNVFAHFEGDAPQLKATLHVLREGTAQHIAHVKAYAAKTGLSPKG